MKSGRHIACILAVLIIGIVAGRAEAAGRMETARWAFEEARWALEDARWSRAQARALSRAWAQWSRDVEGISDAIPAGNGIVATQEREVGEFDGVELAGIADVNIFPAGEFRVAVTTDSNLQDLVGVEVRGGYLHISLGANWNSFNRMPRITVDVHLPELRSVRALGTGTITVFEGSGESLEIFVASPANVDAQAFEAQNVHVAIHAGGRVSVWAAETLTGSVTAPMGRILYRGDPEVIVQGFGWGAERRFRRL
jgi:hypothetical protein